MLKKTFLTLIFLFLLGAPFLCLLPVSNYFKNYAQLARQYECYPIEKCEFDFNGDGLPETFAVVNEPTEKKRHNLLLKIFIETGGEKKPILNIKYDNTDNTFRTHVAPFYDDGKKKLVIYDVVNNQQYFYWDGERLVPSENFSLLEREIRHAMSLEDDTGGFALKLNLDIVLLALFALYYLLFLASVGMYFYFKKQLSLNLS